MAANKEELVSTFLEITMSNCRAFASNVLKDAGWNIEAAIQLFFESGGTHTESIVLPSNFVFDSTIVPTGWGSEDEAEDDDSPKHFDFDDTVQTTEVWYPKDEYEVEEGQEHLNFYSTIVPTGWGSEDETEAVEFQENDGTEHSIDGALDYPNILPVINERLYDDYSEFNGLESNAGTAEDSAWKEEGSNDTNLSMIYRNPICLMFHGNFHEAKAEASHCDRWLLMNVQASEQLYSHLLNRDTWSNATVQELLRSHFIFWQTNQKDNEGQKVCYFYNLMSLPAILVIDPITGEKMYACRGMKQPEDMLEDLMIFSDSSPKKNLVGRTRRVENANASTDQTASKPKETSPMSTTKPSYPSLPEEPTEKKLICKVGICLPSGQRVHRSFHKTDSTKLLWSFCSTLLKEEEESQNFCFIVPSSPKLFYDKDTSFEEAGLSNALLRLSLGGDK